VIRLTEHVGSLERELKRVEQHNAQPAHRQRTRRVSAPTARADAPGNFLYRGGIIRDAIRGEQDYEAMTNAPLEPFFQHFGG
jgi:hypothetical protein